MGSVRIDELVGHRMERDAGGFKNAIDNSIMLCVFVDSADLHFGGNASP